MKKVIKTIILMLILSIYFISGCSVRSTEQAFTEESDMLYTFPTENNSDNIPYTFTAEDSSDNMPYGGQVCLIIENFDADYMNNCALVYGKLKTLFGEPLYETEDNEDLYSYCIRATSENGVTVYFDVYSGPTGPAIGGTSDDPKMNEAINKAAQALVSYIWQAETSDYECKSYYMDTSSEITMGVRNGVPYYNETILNLTSEEFEALFNRIHGLDE